MHTLTNQVGNYLLQLPSRASWCNYCEHTAFPPSRTRSQEETVHSSARTSITLPAANTVLVVHHLPVLSHQKPAHRNASDTAG
jgi:hypothetical protein